MEQWPKKKPTPNDVLNLLSPGGERLTVKDKGDLAGDL